MLFSALPQVLKTSSNFFLALFQVYNELYLLIEFEL